MTQTTDHVLIKRLKILGFILLFFSIIALGHYFFPLVTSEIDLLEKEIAQELEEPEPLHPLLISSVFSVVGMSCLVISWKKKKDLLSSYLENKYPNENQDK